MSEPTFTALVRCRAVLLGVAVLGCEPVGVSLGTQQLCVADARLTDPALSGAGETLSNCAELGDSVLVNAGFEAPVVGACQNGFFCQFPAAEVLPWQSSSPVGVIEIWNDGHQNVPASEGAQFVELDAVSQDTIWQDVPLLPGSLMYWSLLHRGRNGIEIMELLIGPPEAPQSQGELASAETDWFPHSGLYRVGPSETLTRFALASRSGTSQGNFVDGIYFAPVDER